MTAKAETHPDVQANLSCFRTGGFYLIDMRRRIPYSFRRVLMFHFYIGNQFSFFSKGNAMKIRHLLFVFCLVMIAACTSSSSSSNSRLSVRVVDDQGRVLTDVAVIMGGPDGGMVNYGATNFQGLTSFDAPPANAMLTAAYSCVAGNTTFYSINVIYGVNVPGVTLVVHACDQMNERNVNFNVTNAIPGSTESDVTVGPISYGGTQPTFDVAAGIQSDGNFSAFATAYDDLGSIMGYGFALDQPAVADSTVNMTINRTDFARHTHQFTYVPPAAMNHYAYTSLMRKRAQTNLYYNFLSGAGPFPPSAVSYSFTGYADNNLFGAALFLPGGRDATHHYENEVGLIRYLKTVSNQTFDFSQIPVPPTGLTYIQGASSRPVISWTNNEPSPALHIIEFNYGNVVPQRVFRQYSITVPPGTNTITFPVLPDALAACRPEGYTNLSLQTIKFDAPITYNDYLIVFDFYSGAFWEVNGLNRYRYARLTRSPLI
jgi:hypothetical protein